MADGKTEKFYSEQIRHTSETLFSLAQSPFCSLTGSQSGEPPWPGRLSHKVQESSPCTLHRVQRMFGSSEAFVSSIAFDIRRACQLLPPSSWA